MSQEGISSLALININHEADGQIYCPVVIGDFAVRDYTVLVVEEANV